MKKSKKLYSVALVSAALILFLILVSSMASAQTEPEITREVGDTSDEQILFDEMPTEVDGIATESVEPAALKITETQITTSELTEFYPHIYGDRIVWMDTRNINDDHRSNFDIYMYDLSTKKETQITTDESYQGEPDIYGDKIVWRDFRNGNDDIYMYDLSTKKETRITINEEGDSCPAIYSNRIVWTANRNGKSDIYMYDLSTKKETQITTTGYVGYPAIYGDKIVWQDYDNENICIYDLSTKKETQITTNGNIESPAIYDNVIVWMDISNEYGKPGIYMYDLSTEKKSQVTPNQSDSRHPAIYGNRIVWDDNRNGNNEIYVYDLVTGQESHTTDGSYPSYPDIYGDKILWADNRNGTYYDIYMGTISEKEPKLPVANFSAKPTSGKAPLNVAFTDTSTRSPTKWKWDFGDGTSSTKQTPVHKYSKAGTYTVKLAATNAAGSNTATKTNYIKVIAKPVAAFSAKPTSGKTPLNVVFTDKSTGTPTKWKWSFGDGATSTKQNIMHKYTAAGKYTVSLTVSNAAGSNTKTVSNYITVKK